MVYARSGCDLWFSLSNLYKKRLINRHFATKQITRFPKVSLMFKHKGVTTVINPPLDTPARVHQLCGGPTVSSDNGITQ